MKAFIVIPDPCADWLALANGRTPASLPFLDRALIQHSIESLVSRGIKEICVVAFIAFDRTKSHLQDGTRWGANIKVIGSRNWAEITSAACTFAESGLILIGNAETLPDLANVAFDAPGVLVSPDGPTGWAIATAESLDQIALFIKGRNPLEWPEMSVSCALSVATPEECEPSWSRLLNRQMPLLVQTGRERSPGIVVGRGAKIDPNAVLTAPAYVGENAVIGKGCQIGPQGFVAANSIIESGTRITNSIVFPSTYVGANLDIHQKIACRSSILDIVRHVVVPISDDFLLGSTKPDTTNRPPVLEQLLAMIAAIVLLPFTLVGLLFRKQRPLAESDIGYDSPTRDLFCRVIPGLWSVAAGKARFIGAPALPPPVIERLDPELRRVLGSVPKGLVSETYLLFGPNPSEDDLWASSAFLAAGKGQATGSEVLRTYLQLAFARRRPQW